MAASIEFAVQMTCQSCAEAVTKALEGIDGINSAQINLAQEQVVVNTTLPSTKVKELIEATGRKAILQGYGSANAKHLGAAVAVMESELNKTKGVIRFVQTDSNTCVIEGTIDGLPPKNCLVLCVHEFGDISDGCHSCGDVFGKHFQGSNNPSGVIKDIKTDKDGRSTFRLENPNIKVSDIIGRSVIIHQNDINTIHVTDVPEKRLSCGIIARSAGLFQNTRKICTCDGVTIWDAQDKFFTGPDRRSKIPTSAQAKM